VVWFSTSQLCITRLLFTLFLSLSCAHLAERPTLVVPVTCEIICASGAMWFYLGFCASCPVFVSKQPLLPCMYDSIRFGPIRYYSNQNPIAPPRQHPSGKLHAKLLLHSQSAAHPIAREEIDKYQQEMRLQEDVEPLNLWMSNEHKYPILPAFTQYLLVIPASSAPIERVFSVSGYIS